MPDDPETGLNIDATAVKSDVEFQKYITSTDTIERAVYQAFGGYRIETKVEELELPNGTKIPDYHRVLKVDDKARFMNEEGCNYVAGTVKFLISELSSTSNIKENTARIILRANIQTLIEQLHDNYYFLGNTYQIKDPDIISDVVSKIASMFIPMLKSKDGFTLKQLTETFTTAFINKQNFSPQKEGLSDKLHKALSFH